MVTRLSGGLTPGDGADPRTFPAIWNDTADTIEAQGTAIADLEDLNPVQFGTAVPTNGQVLTFSTAVSAYVPETAGGGLEAGAVMSFARNTAPTGWLKANGATISRTTYADLFTAIGTTFGAGDGSTTFRLPDMRGEFPRGWDDGRGVDSGRAFGSAQLDQMQRLEGTFGGGHLRFSGSTATGAFTIASRAGTSTDNNNNNGSTWTFNSANSPNARVSATNSGETRARNLALLFCIKF